MGVLTETSQWDATINQIEVTTPVLGGADGPMNTAPRQLANRTQYLKAKTDTIRSEIDAAKGTSTSLAERMNKLESQTAQGEIAFAGTTGRTVAHSIGNTNYIVHVTPLEDTKGDLGDVYFSKANNAFTIYNTGGFRGMFRYQILS